MFIQLTSMGLVKNDAPTEAKPPKTKSLESIMFKMKKEDYTFNLVENVTEETFCCSSV